jgi:isopenicillin N synthase-like dioxygenase
VTVGDHAVFTPWQRERAASSATIEPMDATVPVVSLDGLPGELDPLSRVAVEIDRACRDVGFFAVVDHGIDGCARDAALTSCRAFFALDVARKERYRVPCAPGVHRGYAGLGAEAQAAAVGAATRPDRSETFTLGPLRDLAIGDEFAVPDVWPDDDVPGMRAALAPYRMAMDALGRRLLRACSLMLFGAPSATDGWLGQPLGALRANHYPALDCPLEADEWRAGAHTDYATLTILTTDDVAGLEILVDGDWLPVRVPSGALLVNVGDVLAVASRGRWRSAWHRVGTPPGPPPYRARTSIAFFQYPDADAQINGLVTDDGRPCAAGEYLRAKVRLLFGD